MNRQAAKTVKRVRAVVKSNRVVPKRMAERASFEICKAGVGALLAGGVLFGVYRAARTTVAAADNAIRAVSSRVPQGITFAPDYRTAAPMETHVDRRRLDALVTQHASRYGVDPDLLRGVIQTESSWNPEAKPKDGSARGLGQLTASTRKALGYTEDDAVDPDTGIEGAAFWLRKKIDEEGGDVTAALHSYRCGPECVGSRTGQLYAARVAKNYGARPPATPTAIAVKRLG